MLDESTPIGISLPKEIISKIDMERKDVSRSRYLLRLIQKAYSVENPINLKKLPQAALRASHSSEPATGGTKIAKESDSIP